MSFVENRDYYFKLFEGFINQCITASEFANQLVTQGVRDRDEAYSIVKQWPERYDIQLQNKLLRGHISVNEFEISWSKLWKIDECIELEVLVAAAFTACDRYTDDYELLMEGIYYSAEQLREYIIIIFEKYLLSDEGRKYHDGIRK